MPTDTLQSIPQTRLSDGKQAYCLDQGRTLFSIPLVDGGLDVSLARPVDLDRPCARLMRATLIAMELEETEGNAEHYELLLLRRGVEVGSSLSELDDVGPPLIDVLTGENLEEGEAPIDPEIFDLAERMVAARSAD